MISIVEWRSITPITHCLVSDYITYLQRDRRDSGKKSNLLLLRLIIFLFFVSVLLPPFGEGGEDGRHEVHARPLGKVRVSLAIGRLTGIAGCRALK